MEDLIKLAVLKEILSDRIVDEETSLFESGPDENKYQKRCDAIEDILQQYGIDTEVSRSHVGRQNFYNVEADADAFDLPLNLFLRHLFDIDEIGLVSFYHEHISILINEDVFNEKYLMDGKLIFGDLDPQAKEHFNMTEALMRDISLMD